MAGRCDDGLPAPARAPRGLEAQRLEPGMAERPDAPQFGDLALEALRLRTVGRERGIFVLDGARCHGEHAPVVPC